MEDGSRRPSDRRTELENAHHRISTRITRLEEAIAELDRATTLQTDAVARLASYRRSHGRLRYERSTLEWEIQESLRPGQSPHTAPPVADETRQATRR